jgi:apoptosis-inducing factor 2
MTDDANSPQPKLELIETMISAEFVEVVIIGASFAGSSVAKQLESYFVNNNVRITVIEQQEVFYASTTTPRGIVREEFAKGAFVPLDNLFGVKRHRVIHGKVRIVTKRCLELESGDILNFDYLVVASGTNYGLPFKMQAETKQEAERLLSHYASLIKEAQRITIVGGGTVGCELAGEIMDCYPYKNVTLINGQAHLLAGNAASEATRDRLKHKLGAMGVEVLLGERVKLDELQTAKRTAVVEGDHVVHTASGKALEANLTFLCLGIGKPNTEYLPTEMLNEKGQVKVKSTLQADHEAYGHVFSLGDVAATGATPWILPIYSQSKVVASNIHAMFQSINPVLNTYTSSPDTIVALTLSSTDGKFS